MGEINKTRVIATWGGAFMGICGVIAGGYSAFIAPMLRRGERPGILLEVLGFLAFIAAVTPLLILLRVLTASRSKAPPEDDAW
jgi:hypothetical protein